MRGACKSCRYLITDSNEIGQELHHLNNSGKVLLRTAEREGVDGVRTVNLHLTVEQALKRVTGLTIDRIGLCEKRSDITFVDREAGQTDADRCPQWKEAQKDRIRPADWRARRNSDTDTVPQSAPREVGPDDPCMCGSGRSFGRCCGEHLRLGPAVVRPALRCVFCTRILGAREGFHFEHLGPDKPVCAGCVLRGFREAGGQRH